MEPTIHKFSMTCHRNSAQIELITCKIIIDKELYFEKKVGQKWNQCFLSKKGFQRNILYIIVFSLISWYYWKDNIRALNLRPKGREKKRKPYHPSREQTFTIMILTRTIYKINENNLTFNIKRSIDHHYQDYLTF